MRLVNIIKGKYFHLLIHRQGTTKHEKHEANGSTEGEADQGWIWKGKRKVSQFFNITIIIAQTVAVHVGQYTDCKWTGSLAICSWVTRVSKHEQATLRRRVTGSARMQQRNKKQDCIKCTCAKIQSESERGCLHYRFQKPSFPPSSTLKSKLKRNRGKFPKLSILEAR